MTADELALRLSTLVPNPTQITETVWDDEAWLPILGHEGKYEVSNFGRVRSFMGVRKGQGRINGRVLQPNAGPHYYSVKLSGRNRYVHRLVAAAFIGPLPTGCQTRHLDGNGFNNRLLNLAYGTISENMLDAVRHGTHHFASKSQCPRGHPLLMPNLAPSTLRRGYRECLACNRASSKVRYSPQLDMQQVSDRYCLSIIAKSKPKSPLLPDLCTEADTATAWASWCRDHTGMTA